MRSRLLETTVLAAVAGAMWTRMPQLTLRWNIRWRLSLKCWFKGHEDWIRRTPDGDVPAIKQEDHSSPRLARSRMRQPLTPGRADHGDVTIAA